MRNFTKFHNCSVTIVIKNNFAVRQRNISEIKLRNLKMPKLSTIRSQRSLCAMSNLIIYLEVVRSFNEADSNFQPPKQVHQHKKCRRVGIEALKNIVVNDRP